MKRLTSIFIIILLLVGLGYAISFVQEEMAFREELRQRPMPDRLHPLVAEKRDQLVADAAELGISILITDGFRSAEEQDRLYAQGRSAPGNIVTTVRSGESYHNFGLAIDFALKLEDGSVVWDLERDDNGNGTSDWFEVANLGKALGFTWGGDWRNFKDYPHLEMTFGLSIPELQEGWRPEDVIGED